MKKIFSLLSAALLLAGSLAFTGCDEVADEILGNTGTWFKYNVTYNEEEGGTGGSTLTCYLLYTDSVYKNSELSVNAYTNEDNTGIAPGLTVVVTNDSNSTIGKIANTSYAIHTFEKGKPATSASNSDTYGEFSNFSISSTLWHSLYVLKYNDLKRVSGIPTQISKGVQNTYKPVQDFSWKRILGQILLEDLLEE